MNYLYTRDELAEFTYEYVGSRSLIEMFLRMGATIEHLYERIEALEERL